MWRLLFVPLDMVVAKRQVSAAYTRRLHDEKLYADRMSDGDVCRPGIMSFLTCSVRVKVGRFKGIIILWLSGLEAIKDEV